MKKISLFFTLFFAAFAVAKFTSFPCSAFFMPESGGFGGVYEGLLKFALIRFFDGRGLLLAGKTAVALG